MMGSAVPSCDSLLILHSNETWKLVIVDGSVEFCEATPTCLVDEPKVSLHGRETDRDLRNAWRCVA